jgi:hypothetical protein
MALGRVAKLFRHPVESLAGEVIARADLGPHGTPVTLWPLRPASELDHHRRGRSSHADVLSELRAGDGIALLA